MKCVSIYGKRDQLRIIDWRAYFSTSINVNGERVFVIIRSQGNGASIKIVNSVDPEWPTRHAQQHQLERFIGQEFYALFQHAVRIFRNNGRVITTLGGIAEIGGRIDFVISTNVQGKVIA